MNVKTNYYSVEYTTTSGSWDIFKVINPYRDGYIVGFCYATGKIYITNILNDIAIRTICVEENYEEDGIYNMMMALTLDKNTAFAESKNVYMANYAEETKMPAMMYKVYQR